MSVFSKWLRRSAREFSRDLIGEFGDYMRGMVMQALAEAGIESAFLRRSIAARIVDAAERYLEAKL